MKVPLVDLKRQYVQIQSEIATAIQQVITDTAFVLGKYTEQFEVEFARYCQVQHCVGLNSGSDGLLLAYIACGVKAGDEVITVANTFFATTEPLAHLGATPVFVDIDPTTYLIDPEKIEAAITPKTKVIVPVHLYGQMADMTNIMAIARKYNLKVIEDCAQAHGATHQGQKAGTFGYIGIYSFYPGKNLGAYGDAGCIVTNNSEYAQLVRKLRDHGRSSKYEYDIAGYSSRMDGLQAAILSTKLKYLEKWNKARRKAAAHYNELLPEEIKKPVETKNNRHVYHLYVIEVANRNRVLSYLTENGVEAGIHYPIPLHLQPPYSASVMSHTSLPRTEAAAKNILSLPLFPEITDEELQYIVRQVKTAIK